MRLHYHLDFALSRKLGYLYGYALNVLKIIAKIVFRIPQINIALRVKLRLRKIIEKVGKAKDHFRAEAFFIICILLGTCLR